MKTIMASELAKKINEAVELFGDAPIIPTDYAPEINQILSAVWSGQAGCGLAEGDRCFFLANEPEGA